MNIIVEFQEQVAHAHGTLDGHPFQAFIPFGPEYRSKSEAAKHALDVVMQLMDSYLEPNPHGRQGWGVVGSSYAEAPAVVSPMTTLPHARDSLLSTLRTIAESPSLDAPFSLEAANMRRMAIESLAAYGDTPDSLPASTVGLSYLQEPKYTTDGRHIINRASGERVPADEPIFIFRARDALAVRALDYYLAVIRNRVPESEHGQAVATRIDQFSKFALDYPNRMKWPDTELQKIPQSVSEPYDWSKLVNTEDWPTTSEELSTERPMGVCVVFPHAHNPDLCLAISRRDNPDLWGFPGGKLDPGETLREAAARECHEEIGFWPSLELLRPIYRSLCEGEVVYDVISYIYVGEVPDRNELRAEEGLHLSYLTGDALTDPTCSPFAEYNLGVVEALDRITAYS